MTQSPSLDTQPVDNNQGINERRQGIKDKCMMHSVCILLIIALSFLLIVSLISLKVTQRSIQPFCPDAWIGLQNKCYYFSTEEGNWNSSKYDCISRGADLTTVDTIEEMGFLMRFKCISDHWIGLEMTENQTLQWVNGTISKIWFPERGREKCAYLDSVGAATARCYTDRKWICRKQMH